MADSPKENVRVVLHFPGEKITKKAGRNILEMVPTVEQQPLKTDVMEKYWPKPQSYSLISFYTKYGEVDVIPCWAEETGKSKNTSC